MADQNTARAVKTQVVSRLAGNAHVNGVGIGKRQGGWFVKVNLRDDDEDTRRGLPGEMGGVPVVVEVVGVVSARS